MNEREMQSLLALAAKRLHTTPEALPPKTATCRTLRAVKITRRLRS